MKNSRSGLGVLILGLLAFSTLPSSAYGVGGEMPPRIEVDGSSLVLNGSALRKKLIFSIYELGVYVPQRDSDAEAIIEADVPKALRLHLLISLDGAKIGSSIARGFGRNDSHNLEQLGGRLDQLRGMFPRVQRGDVLLFRWVPGTGTVVDHGDRRLGMIPGKDFSDALLRVWLGAVTADSSMKDGLLGRAEGSTR